MPSGTNKVNARLPVTVISEPGIAGVKTHVVDLLTHIDLERYDITYYYSLRRSDAAYLPELDRIRARGIECIELPMDDGLEIFKNLRLLFRLIASLRRRRPAVLHLHSSKAGGLGRLAALFIRPRPRVLYTPHAMACYRSRVYLWIERCLALLTDMLIAVSASEKRDFIGWRIPGAQRAEVIPLGLPPVAERAAAHTPPDTASGWTIGACGRICYQKNASLFFQSALELLRQGKDYRFKWIGDFGDDAEAGAVRAMLDRAGNPPQIEITGWVPHPQAHLETLDMFCMFSRYESFGYVTAEAMLLGVPVLATPATGTVDLVQDGVTGSLVEPRMDAIVAALQRLRQDGPHRAALAANARRFVAEHHTVKEMVERTEALYSRHLPSAYQR